MTRIIAMRIEYDGTPFHGFQRQRGPDRPSVQALLEDIVGQVLDEPVQVIGAGRTDAGVHAVGQVVSVQTSSTRPLDVVVHALRRRAHGLIGVRQAWEAPPWFSARHHASRRVYQYHLLIHDSPLPAVASRAWHVTPPLDVEVLRQESQALLGRRDFRAFHVGGASTGLRHFYRTIHRLDWTHIDPVTPYSSPDRDQYGVTGSRAGAWGSWLHSQSYLMLEIEADAFLPRMVRMIVATLVDVARGRRPVGTAADVLQVRAPSAASAPAPAHGLCLVRVEYPPECQVPQEA